MELFSDSHLANNLSGVPALNQRRFMRIYSRVTVLTVFLFLAALVFTANHPASATDTAFNAFPSATATTESIVAQFPAQQPQYVGIPRDEFEFSAAAQENSQWCWAASIQMILNYYGVSIDQKQIVARTYGVDPMGRLPNWSGNLQAITGNLNNWSIDNRRRPYVVQASVTAGAPTPLYLVQELEAKRPVMIGYATGPTSGHAVVITAASYIPTPNGPFIQSLIVRDPWPSPVNVQNRGRVEYPGAQLAQYIQAHWYVRVTKQ